MWSLMVEQRGRCSTEFYPGSFRDIGLKYKMSGLTVSKIWKMSFVKHATENYFHRHTAKGQPKKLEEPELDLVQLLIKSRPSVT